VVSGPEQYGLPFERDARLPVFEDMVGDIARLRGLGTSDAPSLEPLLLAEPHAPTLCGGITRALLVERCRTQVDETLRHMPILSPEEAGAGAPRRRQPAVQNKAGLAGINRIARRRCIFHRTCG
jgi:hypothetical protein